jgi:shikimate 5-dehydrogenase
MNKFLVIGSPIEHSLSPELHNYWIKNNSINAIYEKKKINEDQLEQIISQVKDNKIKGINVTVPFKKTVIPYLDELSAEAQSTQSVNTIYKKDNKIIGHNTDIFGFETSIKKVEYYLGLKKEDSLNLDFSSISGNKFFYDVIYNPVETNFLKIGRELGNKTLNGKLMFIYQAFSAFSIWHGQTPKIDENVIKLLDR